MAKPKGVTLIIRRDGTVVMNWENFPGRDCERAEAVARKALAKLGLRLVMTGRRDKPGGDDDEGKANHWLRQKS